VSPLKHSRRAFPSITSLVIPATLGVGHTQLLFLLCSGEGGGSSSKDLLGVTEKASNGAGLGYPGAQTLTHPGKSTAAPKVRVVVTRLLSSLEMSIQNPGLAGSAPRVVGGSVSNPYTTVHSVLWVWTALIWGFHLRASSVVSL
jgi:hypothetical protein